MPDTQAQWTTFAFILTMTIVVVAFDVVMASIWGPDATISRVTRRMFQSHPILYPMFWLWVGILIGHLHFPTG